MEEFCKKLPKIELHAHLNGSLSPQTLKTLGCFVESIAEYQKLNPIFERKTRTLDECFQLFKVAHLVTKNEKSIYTATVSVINDFFQDNVVYLELRTTPRDETGLTKRKYIETVVRAIQDNKNPIIVKLLLSIDRRHDLKTSNEVVDLIIEMRNTYPDIIKGIDLSGNPNEGIFDVNLFRRAQDNSLSLSLHCAEIKNDEEVFDMFNLKPARIGHGTCIHPDYGGSDRLWDTYCKLQIPTECCLTSNVTCGTSKSYKEHHVSAWIKNSLPFSLATDDKGLFSTSLSKEYFIAHENFNLNKDDLWNISYNSIDQAFASSEEKDKMRIILNNWKSDNIK